MMRILLFCGAFVIFLGMISANADEVFMNDGSRYVGTVSQETDVSFDLTTEQGTMIINKKDVLHIERSVLDAAPAKKKQGFWSRTCTFFVELPKNNFLVVRKALRKVHVRFFAVLEKNSLYKVIAHHPQISSYRAYNNAGYILAVYSCLVLLAGLGISILQSLCMSFLRKIFKVRKRFD